MGSISLVDLMGAYSALEFGVKNDAGSDQGPAINRALLMMAAMGTPNGTLFFPPGTYTIRTTVSHPSNVGVEGFGSVTAFRLGTDAHVDVWKADGVSNIRLRNLRIDGNRANNASGTRNGLWLNSVVDAWIENVECVSARADGFRLDDCERVELSGCKASDNGRHGISLSYCVFCQVTSPRCYNNCQVSSAGAGDGINLELLSGYNTIDLPVCYETALAGDLQGYGIREATGEGCYGTSIAGGALRGNRTGALSIESRDSTVFNSEAVRYLSANLTNPT